MMMPVMDTHLRFMEGRGRGDGYISIWSFPPTSTRNNYICMPYHLVLHIAMHIHLIIHSTVRATFVIDN